MDTLPPPRPSAPPAAPSARGARGFVTVLAWITLALGGLGIAYGALQMALSGLMSSDVYLQLLTPADGAPPLMHWMLTHCFEIGLIEVIASLLLAWLGWGLLRRREWARLAFIAYLALGTLLTSGGIWHVPAMVDALLSSLMVPGEGVPPELDGFRTLMLVFSVAVALVLATLHGGMVWKLSTAGVRVQFQRRP